LDKKGLCFEPISKFRISDWANEDVALGDIRYEEKKGDRVF